MSLNLKPSFDRFTDQAENATDSFERLTSVWKDQPYPVGDQKKRRQFDRWYNERERNRRMSPMNMIKHNYNWDPYFATTSTTTTAYTDVTYVVPAGTRQVTFPKWNTNDPDYQEFEQTRRPPPREFNRYINASDLLEEFIAWVGQQGVRQGEFMDLPVDLFVKWLVIRACEEDQEEPNVVLALPVPAAQPRCLGCQRFMSRDTTIPLHDGTCAERHFGRTSRPRTPDAVQTEAA